MKRFFVLTCFFASLLLFQGCGGPQKPDGFPDLYPCAITVTQEGTPLAGALVILVPKTGTVGWTVEGATDSNGVAVIKTGKDFNGAPAGEFVVRISKIEMSPSELPDQAPKDPVEYEKYMIARKAEVRTTYRMVKPEFDDIKKTPHSITIAQGKNEATFDVGEAIKEDLTPKKAVPTSDSTYD